MRRLVLLLAVFSLTATVFADNEKYLGLPLTTPPIGATGNHYGVSFVEGPLPLEHGGSARSTSAVALTASSCWE
jgi:hypothetical protein